MSKNSPFSVPIQTASTMEINVVVKNPEIVFVADLTRSDAPALVTTAQCELSMKNGPEMSKMTAAVKDIDVKACPFLPDMRKGSITTVRFKMCVLESYIILCKMKLVECVVCGRSELIS